MKIVTFACDQYADIAPAYHYLLERNWLNHPPLVYVTNSQPLNVDAKVVYIKGKDIRYGWRLRKFIKEHYKDELILLMMIDYLVKSVDPGLLKEAEKLCRERSIGHVRLRPMPHPQLPFNENFGEIKKNTAYALSLQPGIWKAQLIYNLCRDEENPWHTETRGSRRMRNLTYTLLSVKDRLAVSHHNYYRYGKPLGVEWVMKEVPEELWPSAAKERKK